ncbi:C-C motif chemokine 8-like [Chanodichthys erythropterus]|uniref:C-C motif chemokine 8-like n=1 Tax=Chanodichthys erythropterus TaxID=933992 RepID=UPI00351E04F2
MTYSMQPSIASSRGPSCAAMMRALLCLLFCLVLFLLCRTRETWQRSLNCCLKTGTDKIPVNRVVDYAVQTAGLCPIDAIILLTTRGKVKCYDPGSKRIKYIMRKVDQKKLLVEEKKAEMPPVVCTLNSVHFIWANPCGASMETVDKNVWAQLGCPGDTHLGPTMLCWLG